MDHTESETDANTTAPAPQAHGQVAARRRFLKGTTLALPAVMTLHSVAAQATARSSLSCANQIPQSPCMHLRPQPDDYFREKVACYGKLKKVRINRKLVFSPASLTTAVYYEGIRPTDQQKCWRFVSNGAIVTAPSELELINCPGNVNAPRATCGPINHQHAIVHFSAIDGQVMAVGEPQTPVGCMMTSLSGACLKSLWGKA
jgi:hypothetical protein